MSAALKSHGSLNTEGEMALRPKGVLEDMKSAMDMFNDARSPLSMVSDARSSLQMVKSLNTQNLFTSSMIGAAPATSVLHAVMGIYCPTIQ